MDEQSLVTAMAAMRKDEVGADCRLLVEVEEVRVHSQVLATRCFPTLPMATTQVPLLPR